MQIEGRIALVTGANRGIGQAFVNELLDRGAAKVYAVSRDGSPFDREGVMAFRVDIGNDATIATAALEAGDVDLLINNAGVQLGQTLIGGEFASIQHEMDINFFGMLRMARAFAPILAANGGGGMLNVLSVLSWISLDGSGSYCASKAAAWSLTNAIRLELANQGTKVFGALFGATDTDMMRGIDVQKNAPIDIAKAALDGIERDDWEILADEMAREFKAALSQPISAIYPQLTGS